MVKQQQFELAGKKKGHKIPHFHVEAIKLLYSQWNRNNNSFFIHPKYYKKLQSYAELNRTFNTFHINNIDLLSKKYINVETFKDFIFLANSVLGYDYKRTSYRDIISGYREQRLNLSVKKG